MSHYQTRDRVLAATMAAGVPAILWGEPGIGKSRRMEKLAELLGADCIIILGSIREPSDFAGLPIKTDDGRVRMAAPDWAHQIIERDAEGVPTVLFLDELSTAPPATQAAMLRIVDERVVGDVRLPDSTMVVCAANEADVAADGWELAPPLANRMCHIKWKLNTDDWLKGMTIGWDSVTPSHDELGVVTAPTADDSAKAKMKVVSFLRSNPALIQAYPLRNPDQAGKAWPSGRTWDRTTAVMAHLPDQDEAAIMVAVEGLVGEAAAIEFMSWLRENDLPDPREVMEDPTSYDWQDKRTDRTMTVLGAVVATAAQEGGVKAWDQAWEVLAEAARNNRADMAAANVRTLLDARPKGGRVPPTVSEFVGVLKKAGMLQDA